MKLGSSLRSVPQSRPILDFLAPSWAHYPLRSIQHASMRTSARRCAEASLEDPSIQEKKQRSLSKEQEAFLDSALRVNQAGELAATLIYNAQTPLITKSHPHLRPLMQHMYDQEAGHLSTFNALLAKHRIRPTALTPVWTIAASFLGWSTAMLGREAAMACTEAVETEIGEHYNNQVRELIKWTREAQERGEDIGEDIRSLLETVRRIRDEELEHLDHAVEEDAKKADGYPALTAVVRGGCKGAIWLSERV